MKTIKDGTALPIAFRSWDCYFNPILRGGIKNNWNVKMSINRETTNHTIRLRKE